MIQWMALGMMFKSTAWAVAFIFVAKGSTRLFFWNEFLANVYFTLIQSFVIKYTVFGNWYCIRLTLYYLFYSGLFNLQV
jgi:hypothetical protein